MNNVGISLGWNCNSAIYGINNSIRRKKHEGYNTCPFDEMLSNYKGIINCINDDFKYFCDCRYLSIITVTKDTPELKHIYGQTLIINTYYNFIFNHESPGHGNLYLTQKWEGGINHYINNNYKEFIKRYEKRINNFINYLKDTNNNITFILHRYNIDHNNIMELQTVITNKYPNLKFNIHIYNIDKFDLSYRNNLKEHFLLMGLDENDEEIKRMYE